MCHDSLAPGGQPVLRDTELGALLDRIAARGTHVVAVLDCCHSGGATREDGEVPSGAAVRGVPWQSWWRGASREGGGPGAEPGRHVLLAACRPQERAYEHFLDGRIRGCFSHALLSALDRLGPTATYGEVHALAEGGVRALSLVQHPELRGPEDGGFLSGEPVPASPFLLRHTPWGWEVNCGAAHGLRSAGAEFALLGDAGARTVVVREVRPESARVDPVGWHPAAQDERTAHAVTPSALAFPPAVVALSGEAAAVRLVAEAVAAVPALASRRTGLRRTPRMRASCGCGWRPGAAGRGCRAGPVIPCRTCRCGPPRTRPASPTAWRTSRAGTTSGISPTRIRCCRRWCGSPSRRRRWAACGTRRTARSSAGTRPAAGNRRCGSGSTTPPGGTCGRSCST